MVTMFLRHAVEDYDTWKELFDSLAGAREANGTMSDTVYRHKDDPNMITVMHDFESAEAAQAFIDLPARSEAMSQMGVIGEPEYWITEQQD